MDLPTTIPIAEVIFPGYSLDPIGRLFNLQGRVFRGIYPDQVAFVKELIDSPMMAELIEKQLFPKTKVTDLQAEGFGLVIEHERIHPVLYPGQWSFTMLKEAALCLLKVNGIANKNEVMIGCGGFFDFSFVTITILRTWQNSRNWIWIFGLIAEFLTN